jgi:drug/metabolite transporter (DMT)-like permease
MSGEVLGIGAAVAASMGFGVADFLGGAAARRSAALPVAARVTAIGLMLLTFAAIVSNAPMSPSALLLGATAGLASGTGLALLYGALMRGGMGVTIGIGSVVVSLITLSADVVLRGDVPSPIQLAGVACAIAATLLASVRRGQPGGVGSVRLAILSGLSFGVALVFLDRAAETSPLWALAAARAAGTALLFVLVTRAWRALGQQWRPVVGAGILDAGGSALFIGSFVLLPVGIATAVSAAAAPLVPMALAWFVLHERVSQSAAIAVALACSGIALIALG